MQTTATSAPQTFLATRLRLAVTRMARRLRQHATTGDASPSMLAALASIERLGPVTLGELAYVERVQPPSMTRIVARLEDDGLVLREQDPTDKRVMRVRLSPQGRRFIRRVRTRKDEYLMSRLQRLSPQEMTQVENAIATIEQMLMEEE